MKKFISLTICSILCGCGGTTVIDLNNTTEVQNMQNVMELEYRDWTKTAETMTKSMINSGAFAKTSNPVIAIANIQNDTAQRFDTDILIKKIRTVLTNSGKTQVAVNYSKEDKNANNIRRLRTNVEYAKSSIPQTGNFIAPNLSLSGKMLQRNLKLESGWFSSVDTRVEYYLQLTLTDLSTGLSVWEGEELIIKEGTYAPTW